MIYRLTRNQCELNGNQKLKLRVSFSASAQIDPSCSSLNHIVAKSKQPDFKHLFQVALDVSTSMITINKLLGQIMYEIYLTLMGKRYMQNSKFSSRYHRKVKFKPGSPKPILILREDETMSVWSAWFLPDISRKAIHIFGC